MWLAIRECKTLAAARCTAQPSIGSSGSKVPVEPIDPDRKGIRLARSAKKPEPDALPEGLQRRLIESLFLIIIVIAAYLLICLLTFDLRDPGFSRSGSEVIGNLGGRFGAWISDLLLVVMGYVAWLVPVLMGLAAFRLLRERAEPVGWPEWGIRIGGLVLILLSGCVLFEMQPRGVLPHTGGIIGDLLAGLDLARGADHLCAVRGQQLRNRRADAARSAADQRRFATEIEQVFAHGLLVRCGNGFATCYAREPNTASGTRPCHNVVS